MAPPASDLRAAPPRRTRSLLALVQELAAATLRGEHFDSFPVNSRHFTDLSDGTAEWLDRCGRLFEQTAAEGGNCEGALPACEALLRLLGRKDGRRAGHVATAGVGRIGDRGPPGPRTGGGPQGASRPGVARRDPRRRASPGIAAAASISIHPLTHQRRQAGSELMGGSLQDQLLRAGLVDQKKARQVQAEKRKERRQPGKAADADQAAARQALADKAARDRELNRQRQEEAQRRALAAEVADLVRAYRVARTDGDQPYHFADGKLVRQIRVTDTQRRQLADGQLAIVRLDQGYELVPAEVARRIGERDAASVVLLNQPGSGDGGEDPYAEYRVPDDLMW